VGKSVWWSRGLSPIALGSTTFAPCTRCCPCSVSGLYQLYLKVTSKVQRLASIHMIKECTPERVRAAGRGWVQIFKPLRKRSTSEAWRLHNASLGAAAAWIGFVGLDYPPFHSAWWRISLPSVTVTRRAEANLTGVQSNLRNEKSPYADRNDKLSSNCARDVAVGVLQSDG